MFGRIAAVMGKELHHILRDPRSLTIIILMPIIMTFLYGHAMNLDVKNIRLGAVDHDVTPESRELLASFTASGQFVLAARYPDAGTAERGMLRRETVLTVVIPAGYAEALTGGPSRPVEFIIDGSNPNTASMAMGYAQGIVSKKAVETAVVLLEGEGRTGFSGLPVSAETRIWYNPELRSSHFIVPALIAVILMMASALLTSVTIVREKESGTLEQLLVSPVRSGELIVGKVLPYGVLALCDGAFILFSGALVFGVPVRGSIAVLFGYTTLYILAALAIGLFISTLFAEQRVATFAALLVTVLPAFMLSDFIFPVRSMPVFLQLVSRIVPATYYIPIVRGILLKGSGAAIFLTNGAFMLGFMLVLLAASVLRFKPRLE